MAIPLRHRHTLLDLRQLKEKAVCLTLDLEQDYGTLLQEPSFEALAHADDTQS